MSCAIWEERVALYAGGDLGTAEAAGVERHLGECAACRALTENLRWSLDGLRETHAEPLAAAHYAAVRARVLAELERPRRQNWAWAWAAALAVAAAAVFVAVMMRPAGAPAGRPGTRSTEESLLPTKQPGVRPTLPPRRCGTGAFACQPARSVQRPVPPPAPSLAELASLPGYGIQDLVAAEVAAAPLVEAPVRMVQLATDDPNVVIYWQLEEEGESGGE